MEPIMQKRRLGRTGLQIAPLVFGGNVFGWTADAKRSFDLLDRFVGAGFNTIDTADVYSAWAAGNKGGESETIIGDWMKRRGNRGEVIVVTKVGSPMGEGKKGLGARYIAEAVEASLKRLQTDHIDLYLSHWPDADTPYAETLSAYRDLVQQGKVRFIGASNLDAGQMRASLDVAKAKSLPRYDVLQPEYNLYDRSSFDGALRDLCIAEEIGVITYFSLAKGFLSGKYRSEADLAQSPRGGGVKAYLNERGARRGRARDGRQARRSRPGLADRATRRHRADRQRNVAAAGRQPYQGGGAASERRRFRRPRRGERRLSAALSPARLGVQRLEVGVGQSDAGRRDILLEMGDFARAGDRQHDRTTLEHPGERDLARRGADLLGDRAKHRAGARKIAGGERIPGNEADAMSLTMVEHLLA